MGAASSAAATSPERARYAAGRETVVKPTELRFAVGQIAQRITESYMVLRDTRKRQAYDRALPDGGLRFTAKTSEAARTAEEERTGKTPNGKKFYATAERAEKAGDVAQARSGRIERGKFMQSSQRDRFHR